jgi:hypothetical protein
MEVFSTTAPAREVINAIYDHIVCLDDDGDVDQEATEEASNDLHNCAQELKKVNQDSDLVAVLCTHNNALMRAYEIVIEVFKVQPDYALVNGVFKRVLYLDDDGDLEEDSTEEARLDLIAAKEWAKTVYGDDSPAATFDAYDRAFDLDSED